jgi:hypothetical protein
MTGLAAGQSLVGADMPSYPPLARAAQIQGSVEIEIQIDNEGKLVSVAPEFGHPVLMPAAQTKRMGESSFVRRTP